MESHLVVEIGIFTEDDINNSKRINLDFKRGENFNLEILDYGIDWLRFYSMEPRESELILMDLLELKWNHKIRVNIKKDHYKKLKGILEKFPKEKLISDIGLRSAK